MSTEFECNHCGATARHLDRPAVYALDGAEYPCPPLTAHSRPAWCAKCNTLVDAEYLRNTDYYEHQLASFRSSELSESDLSFISMTKSTESEFRQTMSDAWRLAMTASRERQSPPRCFTCGSTEISYVPEYEQETGEIATFPHPNCHGSFVRSGCSFVNIDLLYLDSEGRHINGDSSVT